MSGSLQIRGDLGKWLATTANGPLGVNQSLFSFSIWFQWVSFTPGSGGSAKVFGLTANQAFNLNFGGPTSNDRINLFGTLLAASNSPVILGKTFHYAGVLRATGTTHIYIDGAIVSTVSNVGNTGSAVSAVQLGWQSADAGSFRAKDPAIANGVAWTDQNIIDLRDGRVTPADIGATSWWTLQGSAGTNPIGSTAGLADQIGSNHLSIIPGTGGSTTNAVYSATELVYLPPIVTAGPYVTKSGCTVLIPIQTNPALGTPLPAYVTSIPHSPSFAINGTPVTDLMGGPYWTSVGHSCPYTEHQIPQVGPGDVVTYSIPDGFVTTAAGTIATESGTCINYTGQDEPGLWGYSDFGPHAENRMKLGWNVIDLGAEWDLQKNVIHRCGNPWNNAATSTYDGVPLTVNSQANVFTDLWISLDANAIDSKGWPPPLGVWTLYADETAPATPMVPSLETITSPTSVSAPTATAGTIVGGVEVNKKWEWTVTASTNPTTWSLVMRFRMTAPLPHSSSTYPVTLTNLRMFTGGETPDTAVGLKTADLVVQMATSKTSKPPAMFRHLIGADGMTGYAIPSDYPAIGNLSHGLLPTRAVADWTVNAPTWSGNRTIPIYAVRKYDPTSGSRKIYSHQQYGRCVASTDYAEYPFEWVPTDHGLDWDWWFPAKTNTFFSTIEWMCGDSLGNPIKHNLQAGQWLNGFSGLPLINLTNAAGSGTVNMNTTGAMLFPTSPTTFLTWTQAAVPTLTNAFRMGNTAVGAGPGGVQVMNGTCLFRIDPQPPIESYGMSAHAMPGSGVYITLNHCLNDAAVRSFAQRLFDSTPRGTNIYLQFSNEILIPNYQYFWLNALMSIEGMADLPSTAIQRGHEMCEIFADVFGSDASSLVRLFQPHTFSTGQIAQALTYAHAHSIKIDRIAITPYINLEQNPEFTMGAAQMCADNHDSIANSASGVVPVTLPILPVPAWGDICKHWIKYTNGWNGPTCIFAGVVNARNATGYGQGGGPSGFIYSMPTIIGYEGCICVLIPAGVSHTKKIIRAGLGQDLFYNPVMYDIQTTTLQTVEQPGPTGTEGLAEWAMVALNLTILGGGGGYNCTDGNDGLFTQLGFQNYGYQGQPSGQGLSNKWWSATLGGDGASHQHENESVIALASQDWIDGHQSTTASFVVQPSRVSPSHVTPITLTLVGSGTTWTSGSTVSITNSVTGTTTVTKGTFTAISNTSATLTVTTGAGIGTWRLTIDGTASTSLRVASSGARWFGGLLRRRA